MVSKVYSNKICIATNYNCNLKCIYCFQRNKQEIVFNPDKSLNILIRLLSKQTEKGTKIKLHGGEPFLIYPKIKYLCEKLWSISLPEAYHIHITTNGTLVHGEIQNWLEKNKDKITLKLSLDGNKFSQDLNRSQSFDKIDLPFFIKTWPDISVNMTITPQTLPYLTENLIFLHEKGFKDIISHFALFKEWENTNLKRELYHQLTLLANFYLRNPNINKCHLFLADISKTLDNYKCGAMCVLNSSPSFDFQTQKFYPCYMCFPSMAGEKISEELLKIDFYNINLDKEDKKCKTCPFINICVTCYVDNYISRKDIAKRDMNICKYNKIIFAVLFQFEYKRIISLQQPTNHDIKKMLAIKKWGKEIDEIIKEVNHQ